MSDSLALLGYGREIFRPDHEEFRTSTRRFFKKEIEPNVREWEKAGGIPAELFRRAGEAGLLCAGIPAEYGGGGGDVLHHIVLHEEHGYSTVGAAMAPGGLLTDSVAYLMLAAGTEEQKQEWLPRFAAGEVITEIGLTEPHAGSDLKSIRTTARRDGDDYVINGGKAWIQNGALMTMLLVVAKTESADGRTDRASIFIVPLEGTKGVSVGKPTDLLLKGAGCVGDVFFDEVRVPARNLLGGVEGRGFPHALSMITLGRMALATRAMAACELALALTADYVKTRQAFGQRIFDFQNTQFKLATVKADITIGRTAIDQFLKRMEEDRLEPLDASVAKLWSTETEGRVMDECLQFFGGAGYSDEVPISKMYALARLHRIYVGSSEMQRIVIARSL